MAAQGGYIICTAHNIIQDNVKPANVVALYKSAGKWGDYPLNNELIKLRETMSSE